MTKRHVVIATRESPLAIAQAAWVKERLEKIHPHLSVELLGMTTTGDRLLDINLNEVGGKGLFVKELEAALLDGRADIAVHSMKDVPMDLPETLCIPTICEREDPRDVFVSSEYQNYAALKTGAIVGTSSLRRKTQLLAMRSDLQIENLRGNVQTRLRCLDEGKFAAIVLAAAGLKRLGLIARARSYFSVDEILPAAGQGALGIECRENDRQILDLISPLNDEQAFACVTAERAVCRVLNGGCSVPIGAYASIHHSELHLRALVSDQKGLRIIRSQLKGSQDRAESMGIRVAEELKQQGAEAILQTFKK